MKIGLVLSGGGGKGAYELGWRSISFIGIKKGVPLYSNLC